MNTGPALLIGSDEGWKSHLSSLLSGCGYQPVVATTEFEVITALRHSRFAFTLLEGNSKAADRQRLLDALKAGGDAGPIIAVADGAHLDWPLDAGALGIDQVIQEPSDGASLENAIRTVLSRPRRNGARVSPDSSSARLRREVALWRSPRMQEVWEMMQRAARADVTVLISGETGTGKDLVARAIHQLSPRQSAPFVSVNCAAVPKDLLESELFGHEKGAFTGAYQLQTGKFESADGGTILLDEIGDLHPALQAKLLHVLQDGAFSRVGGKSTMRVDVRVLAATNRDLGRAVAEERFRDDLYYRLNVINILVPPLRERLDEIPVLASYFVQRYAKLFQHEGFELRPEAMERLMRHRYPGNVRELENVIKRMIVLGDPDFTKTSFPAPRAQDGRNGSRDASQPSAVFLKEIARRAAHAAEREVILKMLEQTSWNRVRAAKLLNISYRSLLYKMKQSDLRRTPSTLGSSA